MSTAEWNVRSIVARLGANLDVIRALLTAISPEQAVWKPRPEKWSLLEVINHLADEEAEDFRTRVRLMIEGPGQGWPGIDPERWAVDRAYNKRDFDASVKRFEAERKQSIDWLNSLPSIPWDSLHEHPKLPAMRTGDLIASWLAHDLIHIRQLNRLHYEYLTAKGVYSPEYAGKW